MGLPLSFFLYNARSIYLLSRTLYLMPQAVDDSDDDMDDDNGATARLAKCLPFRRYIITKSLLLMSGSTSTVKVGATFCPLPLCNAVESVVTGSMDEISTMRIAASLSLGPLLFMEFCTHCYELEHTSIVIVRISYVDISVYLT